MSEVPNEEKSYIPTRANSEFITRAKKLQTALFEIREQVMGTKIESSRSDGYP